MLIKACYHLQVPFIHNPRRGQMLIRYPPKRCCCRIPNSVHTELVFRPQTAVFTTAEYLSTIRQQHPKRIKSTCLPVLRYHTPLYFLNPGLRHAKLHINASLLKCRNVRVERCDTQRVIPYINLVATTQSHICDHGKRSETLLLERYRFVRLLSSIVQICSI